MGVFDCKIDAHIWKYRNALKNPSSGGIKYYEGQEVKGIGFNETTGDDEIRWERSGMYPDLFEDHNSNFAYNAYCDFWSVTASYPYPGVDRWR